MARYSASWPMFDDIHMIEGTDDQGVIQPQNERQRSVRSSSGQEGVLQALVNSMAPADLDVCNGPPAVALTEGFPWQSMEVPSSAALQPEQLSTVNSSSSLLSYTPPEQQYPFWPTNSALIPALLSGLPNQLDWNTPLPVNDLMMSPQFSANMSDLTGTNWQTQQMPDHHVNTDHSPMLCQGSLFDNDSRNVIWAPNDPIVSEGVGNGDDEPNEADATEPCYAHLLYRCLREAKDHTLTLQEVYAWVMKHTSKAKDPKNPGWRNSAFERIQMIGARGARNRCFWRLTEAALRNGVISTTRYRKDPKRKPERRSAPALKRQLSGAKGGQATKRRQQVLQQAMSDTQRHLSRRRGRGRNSSELCSSRQAESRPQPNTLLPASQPVTPYLMSVDDRSATILPSSSPQTPPQIQFICEPNAKPPPSLLPDFDFGHIDFTNGGVFNLGDDLAPDTPSLATEASFMTDEGIQSLLAHNTSRETSSFP